MVFDASQQSLTRTTIVAWYTGVTHEIKPITSGYRLAILYNIIHTTTAPRPALSTKTSTIERIRHILLSWKQNNDGETPEKLVYLLKHDYSGEKLSGSILKGSDAGVVACLESLGQEAGVRLGLATLEIHRTGDNDNAEEDDILREDIFGRNDYENNKRNESAEMGEVHQINLTHEGLVDLGGFLICKKNGI